MLFRAADIHRGWSEGDCIFFELIWHTDHLLVGVGLKSQSRELLVMDPRLAQDFAGVKEEYRRKFRV